MNPPTAEKRCSSCGELLRPSALFCNNCGAPVEDSAPGSRADAPFPPTQVLPDTNAPYSEVPYAGTTYAEAPFAAAPYAASAKPKSRSLMLPVAILGGGLCLCLVVTAVIIFATTQTKALADLFASPTPTPTYAPLIVPGPIVPPAATLAAAAGKAFNDDFSDPTNGWKVSDSAEYTLQYIKPSGYEILIKQPDYFVYSYRKQIYKNVIVATRGSLGQQPGSYLGLVCRLKDSDNYYAVSVAADSYNIGKEIGGKWVNLTDPTWLKFVTPLQDKSGMLSIAFSCVDDRLGLLVDDLAQPLITDSDLTEGGVGLLAGSSKQAAPDGFYAEALFLEFSTSLPNP